MTPAAAEKRLEKIETQLTPKEWVIRMADEQREYPSAVECLRAAAKKTRQDCLVLKGFDALKKQAEERYPGNKPADIQIRDRLHEALRKEYHETKVILKVVGLSVAHQLELLSLRTTLKMAQLYALVLQDMLGQDALSAPPLLARLEDWVLDASAHIINVLALSAAVQLIENQRFDRHKILFRDWEAQLDRTVATAEAGIVAFNDYLKSTSAIAGEHKEAMAINIEAIKTNAREKDGATLAAQWLKEAADEAEDDFLKAGGGEWFSFQNRIRKVYGQES